MTGYERHEVIGRTSREIGLWIDPDKRAEFVKIAKKQRGFRNQEIIFRKKNGEQMIALWSTEVAELSGKTCLINGIVDITHRKKTEEALRKSESQASTAIEAARGFTFSYDVATGKIEWGGAIEKITGLTPKEFANVDIDDWAERIHPDDRDEVLSILQKAVQEGDRATAEYRFQTKKGYITLSSVNITERDKEGKVVRLVGILQDITKRKQAEKALWDSESKYKMLAENSLTGVFIHQDGKYVFVNDKFGKIHGYKPEELLGKEYLTLIHPDERENVEQIVSKRLKGKSQIEKYEVRRFRKDGKTIWCQMMAQAIEYRGQPAVMGNIIDTTERKQAEEELHRRERELRMIVENIPVLFSYLGKDGRYRFANKRYEEWFGIPRTEIVGKHHRQVLGEATYKLIKDHVKTVLSGHRVRYEAALPYKHGGTRWVIVDLVPDIDDRGKGKGYFAMVSDNTERKRVEEELRESREQLRNLSSYLQSAREQERASIAREIHDDLGQTLTGLKMDLSWMGKRLPKDQELLIERKKSMEGTLDTALETVERIILDLRPGLLDDLGLFAAVEWLVEDFGSRSGIECKIRTDSEEITLDKERSTATFRVLQETLTNIARHANATKVNISLTREAGELMLKVNDNGKGITKKQISHPKSFGLMGIKERAHVFGGKAEINGIRNKGTTVMVSIPIEGDQ